MSVLPKLYSGWPYKQLLQSIRNDAIRFGVNSPEPTTSEVPVPQQPAAVQDASPRLASQPPRPQSPCRPTIIRYEPPSFSLDVSTQMFTRAERNQVLQNHVAAANAAFSKVAVFEDLIQKEPHNANYYKEVQRVQKNQHIQVAIKLQHMLEADDTLRKTAVLPLLDLPEHLWSVQDMQAVHTREEDFIAITAEIEVLC